jgi:hypothetical protein
MKDRWTKRAESVHRHEDSGVSTWGLFSHVPKQVKEDDTMTCSVCGEAIIGLVYKSDKRGNNYHMSCA